jgi:hypothetical protein
LRHLDRSILSKAHKIVFRRIWTDEVNIELQ